MTFIHKKHSFIKTLIHKNIKKSKSVFAFLTYSRETWFIYFGKIQYIPLAKFCATVPAGPTRSVLTFCDAQSLAKWLDQA